MTLLLRIVAMALLAACATACATLGFSQTSPPSSPPPPPSGTTSGAPPAASPSTTLASYGNNKILLSDYDAWVTGTIPERDRFGWAMSQNSINKAISDLLRQRVIAEEARRRELDKNPLVKLRVEQYAEKILNDLMVQRIEEEANREFDEKKSSFLERAREQYLVNKSRFQTQKEVKASHILIDTKSRTSDEALAKIKALRQRAVAGESFAELAKANSDDPSARSNSGELGYFAPGRMDPAFDNAVFAMQKPNEISEPFHTQFGWHIVKLEDVKPAKQLTFEEATPDLMDTLRAQYLSTRQSQMVAGYFDMSKVHWNEPAVVGLKKTVDPTVLKPLENQK